MSQGANIDLNYVSIVIMWCYKLTQITQRQLTTHLDAFSVMRNLIIHGKGSLQYSYCLSIVKITLETYGQAVPAFLMRKNELLVLIGENISRSSLTF